METDDPDPSQEFLTEHYRWRAVEQAHRLLEIIDKRWPAETGGEPRWESKSGHGMPCPYLRPLDLRRACREPRK